MFHAISPRSELSFPALFVKLFSMNCNGRFSVVLCFHRVHHGDDLAELDELPELRLFKILQRDPEHTAKVPAEVVV